MPSDHHAPNGNGGTATLPPTGVESYYGNGSPPSTASPTEVSGAEHMVQNGAAQASPTSNGSPQSADGQHSPNGPMVGISPGSLFAFHAEAHNIFAKET